MKHIIFCFLIILSCSCNEIKDKTEDLPSIDTINSIVIDSLQLNNFNSSLIGEIKIRDEQLYFMDYSFCWISVFDKDGNLLYKKIGQGEGPNELAVRRIMSYEITQDKKHIMIGTTWDAYIFDSNFNKIIEYRVNWSPKGNVEELLENPDPSDPGLYGFFFDDVDYWSDDKYLYFPIYSQSPTYNLLLDDYFNSARVLGKMKISNGKVEELFGSYPNTYINDKNSRVLSYAISAPYKNNELLVTFPIENKIYQYDKKRNIIDSFGIAGKEMDQEYQPGTHYDDVAQKYKYNRKEKGYYKSIKYIKEENLVFRSYQKSGNALYDGLQIYQDKRLIADIEVPKNTKVIGKIGDWYYSQAIPKIEENSLTVYKLKLIK